MSIPITKVLIDEAEMAAVIEPLQTGWLVQGPHVKTFEDKFAAYTNSQHAIATTSCTTALHLSLAAAGIGPGDEVIVPAFTWISTANVAEYLGATPVFCDIDLATFNLDIAQLANKITTHTKAIIPVHLFGLCADMEPILALAKQHNLVIVEDAACGFGAWYHGQHAGTMGDFGCFSFHPRKAITTGEGGMILTQDDASAKLCRTLRDHGADRTDLQRHTSKKSFLLPSYHHLGFNYRMTDLQGAVGSIQMDKAAKIQAGRTERAIRYNALIEDLRWLQTPQVPKGYVHGYQSYVCLFQPEAPTVENSARLYDQRNELMQALEEEGIATRQGTHAVTGRGYYQEKYGIRDEDYPNAMLAERLSLTLPVYPQMTDEEQDRVVAALKKHGARFERRSYRMAA